MNGLRRYRNGQLSVAGVGADPRDLTPRQLVDFTDAEYRELYRDMVTVIRDRIADMIKKGMTLEQVKAARDFMGADFWPYGVEENRKTLETFVRYMHEQGLTPERLSLDALFPDSTHRTFRI